MTGIKAVIFDLDGVIADSEGISADSTAKVLERRGVELTDGERQEAFGRRTRDIFSDALSRRNLKADIAEMAREKDVLMRAMIREGGLKPISNSIDVIRRLKDGGKKVALATSSHKEKMEMELRELGIEGMFPVKVTGDDVRKGKPDPEIFLLAAKKLGVKPSECAVIEDSAFGVQAAKSAGMLAIGFSSPSSPGQDLSSADTLVSDIRDAGLKIIPTL